MRPKWGQNFLISSAWQKTIVEYFSPPEKFGEIGPGEGALTNHLRSKFGQEFLVFERDEALIRRFHSGRGYDVITGNFLDWDFQWKGLPVQNFSLIGNLPYEVGTGIVKEVALHSSQIAHFVFLLQKEVVERLIAKPRTKAMGSLTVLVQGQFDLIGLDVIGPEHFNPQPKVWSQLVRANRRKDCHRLDSDYLKFVQASFLSKRRTLVNNWKNLMEKSDAQALLERFSLSPLSRAEELAVDLWPRIFSEYHDGR